MALLGTYLQDMYTDGSLRAGSLRSEAAIHLATSHQYYPVGTKLDLHGRTFRYGRTAEAITITHRGSPNLAYVPWHTNQLYATKGISVNAAKAGDKQLTSTFDDYGTDTTPYNMQYKNYFQNGLAVIFQDTNVIWCVRIAGNEIETVNADSAANGDMIIYLAEPLPADLTSTSVQVDLYPSPYMNQGAGSSVGTYGRVTGIPMCTFTSGYWGWFQTKGPCWVTPTTGITTANVHQVVFHTDGTVKVNSGDGLQLAGYMIYRGDGSADDSVIMLQLE